VVPTPGGRFRDTGISRSKIMGKYLIGWILGVPVVVLVVVYIVMH